jgi:hypothetical protein
MNEKRLIIFGHKMAVVQIVRDRIYLTCYPDCCHSPYHMNIEMNLEEYNRERKKQGVE